MIKAEFVLVVADHQIEIRQHRQKYFASTAHEYKRDRSVSGLQVLNSKQRNQEVQA